LPGRLCSTQDVPPFVVVTMEPPVENIPTATHVEADGHEIPSSTLTPTGMLPWDQLVPPLADAKMTAEESDPDPTATHVELPVQEIPYRSVAELAWSVACDHDNPVDDVVRITTTPLKLIPAAAQSVVDVQEMLVSGGNVFDAWSSSQVAPASVVDMTPPAVVVLPTATQSVVDAHETLVSWAKPFGTV